MQATSSGELKREGLASQRWTTGPKAFCFPDVIVVAPNVIDGMAMGSPSLVALSQLDSQLLHSKLPDGPNIGA